MNILLSATLTVIVLFLVLLGLLTLQRKVSKTQVKSLIDLFDMTAYNLLMFLGMLTYLFVVTICDALIGEFSPLVSAILLIITVFLVSQFSLHTMNNSQNVENRNSEKKFAVLLSTGECVAIFLALALFRQNLDFIKYACVSIAIILGFFVPLDALVANNLTTAWELTIAEFNFKDAKKRYKFIPTIVITLIVIVVLLWQNIFPEKTQTETSIGLAIGSLVFLIIALLILRCKKSSAWIQNTFFPKQ